MSKSNNLAAESYLEKAKSSGLMNERNRAGFEAVAEMLRHPYSLEQAKAQVARAEAKRNASGIITCYAALMVASFSESEQIICYEYFCRCLHE